MPLPDNFNSDATTLNSTTDADTSLTAALVVNQNVAGGFTALPPKQFGENRVPAVSGFMVQGTPSYSALGAVFTLVWQSAQSSVNQYQAQVAGYRIYAQQILNNNQTPTLVGTSADSPCVVRIVASQAGTVTFWCQTFLLNGNSLPLAACPTCTGTAPNPYFEFDISGLGVRINNDIYFSGTGGNVGIEVYTLSTGLSGPHTSIIANGMEVDGTAVNAYASWNSGQLLFTDAAGVGGHTLALLGQVTGSGHRWGELTMASENASTNANLSARTTGIGPSLLLGATHSVEHTCTLVAAPGGGIVGGITVYVDGVAKTLAYY